MAKEFSRQFYRSKEWKAVRDYCMMRDKYLCRKCGRPAEEVHHKTHLTPANIMDVSVSLDPGNLVCLCRDCHSQEHLDDQADGRPHKFERNILQKIIFDDDGNVVISPPVDVR